MERKNLFLQDGENVSLTSFFHTSLLLFNKTKNDVKLTAKTDPYDRCGEIWNFLSGVWCGAECDVPVPEHNQICLFTLTVWPYNYQGGKHEHQGGRGWGSVIATLSQRAGSSPKGCTPNIYYFVAKRSIVAIYKLFERLSWSFQLKSSCFGELSIKVILLLESLLSERLLSKSDLGNAWK